MWRFLRSPFFGIRIMLVQIPISPQANTAFSESPKGIEKVGKIGNDFSDTFEAAAAARRQNEFGVDETSENEIQAKIHGKGEDKSSKGPSDKDRLGKEAANSEKPGRKTEASEAEMIGSEPISMEEEVRHSQEQEATPFQGFLGNDPEKNADVIERLKEGKGLSGSSANDPGDPRSNPAVEEAPAVEFVSLESQKVPSDATKNNGDASTRPQSPKDKANGEASTLLRPPPQDKAPIFLDSGEKLTKSEIDDLAKQARGMPRFKMGEEKADAGNADAGNVKKAVENISGAAVKAFQRNHTSKNTKEKTAAETSAIFRLKKSQSFGKSVKSAWETKISDKKGRENRYEENKTLQKPIRYSQ